MATEPLSTILLHDQSSTDDYCQQETEFNISTTPTSFTKLFIDGDKQISRRDHQSAT
jgi:hypothetical protein